MTTFNFIVTRDGHKALTLKLGGTLEPDLTHPKNLREQLFKGTGIDALLLHDDGLQLGLNRDFYDVRMEALSPLSQVAVSRVAEASYVPVPGARAWQQPGWFRKTLEWLEQSLDEGATSVEQYSTYDLACVLRVQTETQTVYLKASATGLEAAVSAHLAITHPGLTPHIVLSDVRRALLVTKGCGLRLHESSDKVVWATALGKLARFHEAARADDLQVLGCPVYDFDTLGERAARFLQDEAALRGWGVDAEQLQKLSHLPARVLQAHRRVSALGLPPLSSHGDAHPMNVLIGCGTVWFDWSEAGVAHPFLDVGWFLAWLSHPSRHTLPLRQTHPKAATELWHAYLQALTVPDAEPLLADAMLLALAHRVLVYHARFHNWLGTVAGWRPEYVPYYLRALLQLPL